MSEWEDITVQCYNWQIEDKNTENDRTNILSWCMDRDSKPYLCKILNFPESCMIELPSVVGNRYVTWTKGMADTVANYLKYVLQDNGPENARLVSKPRLYYYQNKRELPFLQVSFTNKNAMRACTNLLKKPLKIDNKTYNFKVWEDNISIVRKLLTIKQLRYTQWFNVKAKLVAEGDRISKLEKEYAINWGSIQPISDDETTEWITHPGIFVIDGEMYAQNKKAMPNKLNSSDVCYMISCIYQQDGLPDTRKRYLIVIGEKLPSLEEIGIETGCPELTNAEVIRCKNEIDLGNKLADLVNELDPVVFTGYNILSFDIPYLNARRERVCEEWPVMGRLHHRKAYMKPLSWNSSGSGYNDINFLVMDGRINFDALHIARRELKLPRYNLDTVAKAVLDNQCKNDVGPQEMFAIWETYLLTENALKKVHELKDKGLINLDKYQEILEKANGEYQKSREKLKVVADYCVQDSELVMLLMDKWKAWIYLIELSKIVGINPEELFTRGQQIRVLHQVYDLASREGYVIDRRDLPEVEWSGGFVGEPDPGLYDHVICLDFKSLYPSIIMAYNLCYTTLVPIELYDIIPDDKCNIIEWDEEVEEDEDDDDNPDEKDCSGNKNKIKKMIHLKYKFIKSDVHKGLLPRLVGNLIDERNEVKKQMKKAKGSFKVLLDKRQLGLKVTANSFFGALGAQKGGKLPLIEVARVITAKGRDLITYCNKYVEKKYNARIVYNDTDSTMFVLPFTKTYPEAVDWALKLEIEISALFPDPLYTEAEKVGRMFAIKKKKYAYWQTWMFDDPSKGIVKGEFIPLDQEGLLIKGVVLARRDNCQFQREVYHKILMNIMNKKSMQETLDIITEELMKLYTGQVNWQDLIIVRGLGAHYKSDNYFMKIFGEEIAKLGKPASPGDRLEYVIVKTRKEIADPTITELLGYKMRLPETYIDRLDSSEPEPIDTGYYMEKFMMNCIEQLWQIGYKKELAEISDRNTLEDKFKVINELSTAKDRWHEIVMGIWNYYSNHFVSQYLSQGLSQTEATTAAYKPTLEYTYTAVFEADGLKTASKTARSKHISGRKVFDTRVNSKPIKTIFRSTLNRTKDRDLLVQTISSFAKPELAKTIITQLPPAYEIAA